jgi:hypothetical protein
MGKTNRKADLQQIYAKQQVKTFIETKPKQVTKHFTYLHLRCKELDFFPNLFCKPNSFSLFTIQLFI